MKNNSKPNSPKSSTKSKTTSAGEVIRHFGQEIRDLFSLKIDTDEAGTIDNIQKSIAFKGGNLWGLIFAAFIASIGLNVNSGAVVIGAMLISPLMGPIVGTGYAIATNDFETLKSAMRNLAIFIIVSILASMLYFGLSPIKTLTEQLEARTYPTFYDVLIAICGGAIGIVASSRTDRGNAIPGVAIATALMPPLCTVGYGLATFNWAAAAGAFYLFFINSVFIAGTAFVFVSALKFPHKEFLDPVKEKHYKTIMIAIVVLTIIPSIYTAYNVVQEELFNSKVTIFTQKAKAYQLEKGLMIGNPISNFRRDTPTIELTFMGKISKKDKENLHNELKESGLMTNHTKLLFRAGNGVDAESLFAEFADLRERFTSMKGQYSSLLQDLYKDNKKVLEDKDKHIQFLEKELNKYKGERPSSKPISKIALEFSVLFPEAKEISYNELIKINTRTKALDTIPTVVLDWESRRKISNSQKERISKFFQARMNLDTIQLIVY